MHPLSPEKSSDEAPRHAAAAPGARPPRTERRMFVGGPLDGQTREVDVVSVLALRLEDENGDRPCVKYYLGVDGLYHFGPEPG